jgi:hypothetical protein
MMNNFGAIMFFQIELMIELYGKLREISNL